jgi:hypothetical protein
LLFSQGSATIAKTIRTSVPLNRPRNAATSPCVPRRRLTLREKPAKGSGLCFEFTTGFFLCPMTVSAQLMSKLESIEKCLKKFDKTNKSLGKSTKSHFLPMIDLSQGHPSPLDMEIVL